MRGDFSRLTWDRRNHYSAVLMQQGRLQLDADWNEQIDIIMHRLETEVADYVGHSGVPARSADAFHVAVTTDSTAPGGPVNRLQVAPGRIYIEGSLVESEDPVELPLPETLPAPPAAGPALAVVYLDTWQRQVTFVDDPAIREVALGGPDTATRRQTACAVRAQWLPTGQTDVATLPHPWQPSTPPISSGLLNARVSTDLPSLENQLYRVEIHSVDADGVHFTWSRDNACVASIVTQVQAPNRSLQVSGGGRDRQSALADRQWVELLTRAQEDAGARGPLVQIEHVDHDQVVVTEQTWPWTGEVPALSVLRRWDNPTGLTTGPVVRTTDSGSNDPAAGWIALEGGIEVRFEAGQDGRGYTPGDYWLIASRAATSAIEWPATADGPVAQSAAGVRHTFAALSLLELTGDGRWMVPQGGDLRTVVSPLDDGFVSMGAAGSTMRGPLSVQPLLTATHDGQVLTALLVDPAFDDAGHSGGRHVALQVNGDVMLGSEERPISATTYGYFNVVGSSYARSLNVNSDASIGYLSVSGSDGKGNPSPQWALRLGDPDPIGIDVAAAPDATSAGAAADAAAANAAAANAAASAAAAAAVTATSADTAAAAAANVANSAANSAAAAATTANEAATKASADARAATDKAAAAKAAFIDAATKATTTDDPAVQSAETAASNALDAATADANIKADAAKAAAAIANTANADAAAANAAANAANVKASATHAAAAEAATNFAAANAVAANAGAATDVGGADVGYLRFGDSTGKKFHFARARESVGAQNNKGIAGALLTVSDQGRVGIGTTNPAVSLHIASRVGGMESIALTSVSDLTRAAALLSLESTPNSTLFIGGVYSDTVQLFWKSNTGLLYAASIPATDQLTNQLRNSLT